MAAQSQNIEPLPASGYGPRLLGPEGHTVDTMTSGTAFDRNTRAGNSAFLAYHAGGPPKGPDPPTRGGLGRSPSPTTQDRPVVNKAPLARRPLSAVNLIGHAGREGDPDTDGDSTASTDTVEYMPDLRLQDIETSATRRVDSRKDKHIEVVIRDSHKVCIAAFLNQRLIPTINSDKSNMVLSTMVAGGERLALKAVKFIRESLDKAVKEGLITSAQLVFQLNPQEYTKAENELEERALEGEAGLELTAMEDAERRTHKLRTASIRRESAQLKATLTNEFEVVAANANTKGDKLQATLELTERELDSMGPPSTPARSTRSADESIRELEEANQTARNIKAATMTSLEIDLAETRKIEMEARRTLETKLDRAERDETNALETADHELCKNLEDIEKRREDYRQRYPHTAAFQVARKEIFDKKARKVIKKVVTVIDRYGSRPGTDTEAVIKLMRIRCVGTDLLRSLLEAHEMRASKLMALHVSSANGNAKGELADEYATLSNQESVAREVIMQSSTGAERMRDQGNSSFNIQEADEAEMEELYPGDIGPRMKRIVSRVSGVSALEVSIEWYSSTKVIVEQMTKKFGTATERMLYEQVNEMCTVQHRLQDRPSETMRNIREQWNAIQLGANAIDVKIGDGAFLHAITSAFSPSLGDIKNTDATRAYISQRHVEIVKSFDEESKELTTTEEKVTLFQKKLDREYEPNTTLAKAVESLSKRPEGPSPHRTIPANGRVQRERTPRTRVQWKPKKGRTDTAAAATIKPKREARQSKALSASTSGCFKCGSENHTMTQCTNDWVPAEKDQCFACLGNHRWRDCPESDKEELSAARREAVRKASGKGGGPPKSILKKKDPPKRDMAAFVQDLNEEEWNDLMDVVNQESQDESSGSQQGEESGDEDSNKSE